MEINMKKIGVLCVLFFMAVSVTVGSWAAAGKNKPLTNSSVIALVKAGLGDSAIVALIKSSPSDYDKSVEAMIELKKSGVSNAIIEAMASAGTAEAPEPAKKAKDDLPSAYGIYSLGENGAQALQSSPITTLIGTAEWRWMDFRENL